VIKSLAARFQRSPSVGGVAFLATMSPAFLATRTGSPRLLQRTTSWMGVSATPRMIASMCKHFLAHVHSGNTSTPQPSPATAGWLDRPENGGV